MSALAGAILFFIVAMTAFMVGTVYIIRSVVSRLIGQKHRLLEEIMETGKLPQLWSNRSLSPAEIEKQVKKLTTYVRKTRLVDSDETRNLLLTRLELASAGRKE